MKNFNFLFFLLIAAISFSCQNNESFELETTTLNSEDQLYSRGIDTSVNPHEEFENVLQWTSYIIATANSNSQNAEAIFIHLLNKSYQEGTPGVIQLSDLLDTTTENRFEKAFKDAYFYYFHSTSDCDDGGTRNPRGNPTLGDPPGIDPQNTSYFYNSYLNFILNESCLEIYVPNGYNTSVNNIIYTTSHPLDDSPDNEAYIIPEQCHDDVTIGAYNLHLFDNVIVTRPYRQGNHCTYEEIDVDDFTQFLRN